MSLPRGFHKTAFERSAVPLVAVSDEGIILAANAAYAERTGAAVGDAFTPDGHTLTTTLSRKAGDIHVHALLPAPGAGTPDDAGLALLGDVLARGRRAVTVEELCRLVADAALAVFEGAAVLLVDADQLVLQHSTFPQPGRTFARDADHRYARMARGELGALSESGEALLPLDAGDGPIGHLVLRLAAHQQPQRAMTLGRLIAGQLALLLTRLRADDGGRVEDVGLARHAAFEHALSVELMRARRYERPLAVALVSADGPADLDAVGRELVDQLRANDLVARYREDAFALLLPETTLAQAQAKGESLRRTFAEGDLGTTVSVGIAGRGWGTTEVGQLLEHSDLALTQARADGGDAVCYWQDGVGHVPRRRATPLA